MNLEYPGANLFYHEVEAVGKVWVAKGSNQQIYSLELDKTGFSLPVWSHKARVVEYLKNANLVGSDYEPFAIPLDIFTEVWLSNKLMDINELLVNMNGTSTRALVLTVEEFRASQHYDKAS